MTDDDTPGVDVQELAMLLSVAVRIEPELIRAVRVELTPRLNVGAEGDLWFSDWVGSRSADSIRLRSDIVSMLHDRLAARLTTRPSGVVAHRLWPLIEEVHQHISPALLLEEKLNWTAVKVAAGVLRPEAIDEALQPALRAAVGEARTGVAEWFAGAYDRLPPGVRSSVAGWQLLQASPAGAQIADPVVEMRIGLADVYALGDAVATAWLPIRHDGARIVLNERTLTPQHLLLRVPDTRPRVVRARWSGGDEVLRIDPDRIHVLHPGAHTVSITTGRGEVFELGAHTPDEAGDIETAALPIVFRQQTVRLSTADELRNLASDFRYRRAQVDENIVAAIEEDVQALREQLLADRSPTPPGRLVEMLPLLGWLIYETSWNAVLRVRAGFGSLPPAERVPSETAMAHVNRLADAARRLPWPEFAPRAVGAIRAQALAESKRDTQHGYEAAWMAHLEARERLAAYADSHGDAPERNRFRLDLDEMSLQLALAETGTACRMAERITVRWAEEYAEEDEQSWLLRMSRQLEAALDVGLSALTAAERIQSQFGLADRVDENRLTLVTGVRNPGIMTGRTALLALAMSSAVHHLKGTAADWPETKAALIARFERAYHSVEKPVPDVPMHKEHQRALVWLRLGMAILVPGHSLPSQARFAPCMEHDVLDDVALEALSEWLAKPAGARFTGFAAGATMPEFIRSIEECRAASGAATTYRDWRKRWVAFDRYADEPGRRERVEAALALDNSEAVRRAVERADLLALAVAVDQAVTIVRQREVLIRQISDEQSLFSQAVRQHFELYGRGTDMAATRSLAAVQAILEFCHRTGILVPEPGGDVMEQAGTARRPSDPPDFVRHWANGYRARALESLTDALSHIPQSGTDELSLCLSKAECLIDGPAGEDAISEAIRLGERALTIIDMLMTGGTVIGGSRSPLAIALCRVYGDIALLASRLDDQRASELGLRVAISAKRTALKTQLRLRLAVLPPRVRAILANVVEIESVMGRPPPPGKSSAAVLERLRQEIDATVSPALADTALPVPLDLAQLLTVVGDRHVLDFVWLPGSLEGLPGLFRSWIHSGRGVSFERVAVDPGHHDHIGYEPVPSEHLIPADLPVSPVDLVISADGWLHGVPWPALKIDDSGTRLIERATITHCPVLTMLEASPPPTVAGGAVIRLVGLGEDGLYVDDEILAWGLPGQATSLPLSSAPVIGTRPPSPLAGTVHAALSEPDRWGFLHLTARGQGADTGQQLDIPGEDSLSYADALGLHWPPAVLLLSSNLIHRSDVRLGIGTAALSRGARCVVAPVNEQYDPGTAQTAAGIITSVRTGNTSLPEALRTAQLKALRQDRPESTWAYLAAFSC